MKQFLILCAAVLALSACGKDPEPAADAQPEQVSWLEFAAATIDRYYEQNPEAAVYAGLHEFDGQISDISPSAMSAYSDWIDAVVAEANAYENLEGIEAFERDYMIKSLQGEQFWVRDSGFMNNNPVVYTFALGMDVFIDREYAPIEERIVAYTQYVSGLPKWLQTMQTNLEPPLPAPYVETSYRIFAGMADYLENTVPGLLAAVEDEQLQRQFAAANTAAESFFCSALQRSAQNASPTPGNVAQQSIFARYGSFEFCLLGLSHQKAGSNDHRYSDPRQRICADAPEQKGPQAGKDQK